MLSRRKSRPLERTEGTLRDARLIVIASEGSVTEAIYFNLFRLSRVQVRCIPSMGGRSSPQHVIDNLRSFREEYEIGEGDELWLAIDRDSWPVRRLSEIAADCMREGFGLAVSVPSFEIWLALHFDAPIPVPTTVSALTAHLKSEMGRYAKATYPAETLLPRIDSARKKARALDSVPADRWPQEPGTRIYRIADQIRG